MNHLIKIIYSIQLDDKIDILRQIWINEKSDLNKLKVPNFDNPHEDFINIILKAHPDFTNNKITIVSATTIDPNKYLDEIGKEFL
ncbi:hypothetical protein ABIB62_000420 [Mucilaginibacter sp. UYP25]|uniref:hypothetical protein n=1 Tax=unclassified Mucilaginibacter TaxID=2617802 RepID=UPI00339386FB